MQPSVPQPTGAGVGVGVGAGPVSVSDMDLAAVQSMDWLFKKDRIYLLAQFWQQRATLAEKEANTLKEQLSTSAMPTSEPPKSPSPKEPATAPATPPTNSPSLNNINNNNTSSDNRNSVAISNQNGGILAPSPSPPLSDSGSCRNKNSESVNNNNNCTSNNNNISSEDGCDREKALRNGISGFRSKLAALAAKDKEIKALNDEVQRLQTIKDTHIVQIQRLEEYLQAKAKHIVMLETRLESNDDEGEPGYAEDLCKEEVTSLKGPLDVTSPTAIAAAAEAAAAAVATDRKQLQDLFERTKSISNEVGCRTSRPADDNANQSTTSVDTLSADVLPSSKNGASEKEASLAQNCGSPQRSVTPPAAGTTPQPAASFQNVEQFGSLLGEELVSRYWPVLPPLPPPPHLGKYPPLLGPPTPTPPLSLQLPLPLPPPTGPSSTTLLSQLVNSTFSTANSSLRTDTHHHAHFPPPPALDHGEKMPTAADSISSATSTPNLSDDGAKAEKNNNLGPLQHGSHGPHGFLGALPFQYQDRTPHFRFNDELPRLADSLIPKSDPMEARLQEMLRYNMDKYANQNLDTLHISRRIRELLSVHNIGQRLFAKYVLGLSQGTVSELLSKPKPWDKLTEKGRDSYRKMHAWACDDNAVMLLKTLIPKKAPQDGNMPPQFGRADESLADDRIAHILSEASGLIKAPQPAAQPPPPPPLAPVPVQQPQHSEDLSQGNEEASKSPCTSPFYKERRVKQEEEKVSRIYQEELAKLMNRGPRDNFPGGGPGIPDDNVRLALETYHKEMAKLAMHQQHHQQQQHQAHINGAQDLSVSKENGQPKPEMPTPKSPQLSSNSILQPAMAPTDDFSAAASPLQRMASITNSLITQPPVTPHHSQQQRPKAILPPITQQQFDLFNNLNTEEIVRHVKEALSQYSISQRLFGENVLGLSQGSVSDLLARPKPWHMLTQKGREPFIRMKMFLEDEHAVHKLVASQYKIAPEKLMRTGSYTGSPQIPQAIASKLSHSQPKLPEPPQHLMHHHQGMLLTTPGLPPHHAIALPPTSVDKKPLIMPVQHSPQPQPNAMRSGLHQHLSPTVYEMAALTQDLDTHVITTKIKEALLANNIGQKIFGEAVLGLSQGSVSELLSKPKPWHMLSIKGREPFIRMQLWLTDGNNVERLQSLKNERREASKMRRSLGQQDNGSDTSSNDTNDFYATSPGPGSVGSSGGGPPSKKQRVLFSEEQKEALRLAFALDPYPNVGTIEFLANELGLVTRTITNWFHNHRMRLKQHASHAAPAEPAPSRDANAHPPFDPVQFRLLLNQRLVELQKDRMGLNYFAGNPNLVALMSRGEADLRALNHAFKEQMSGLDLSRKRDDDFDEEAMSDAESVASEAKSELKEETPRAQAPRSSRRKPAAPQWVNPEWQDNSRQHPSEPTDANNSNKEVVINGVCVMQPQAEDYERAEDDDNDNEQEFDHRLMEPEIHIKQEEDCNY